MHLGAHEPNNKPITIRFFSLLVACLLLTSCATTPPSNIESICSIFRQYPHWYWAAKASRKRWQVPISTQMAIMYYESHFRAKSRPDRKTLLGFIPWKRPTTAYGYSQATNGTWAAYQRSTRQFSASRTDFADSIDFVGWYTNRSAKRLGLRRKDAYSLYLAYHEGNGGFRRKTYLKKPWLLNVASRVQRRANKYYAELSRCESSLPSPHWWNRW